MKWCPDGSEYRYSIWWVSRMARSTFSVEPKRCSKLLPLFRLRMRTWTKPRQLPGVTWCTFMTRQTSFSKRMHMPARTWLTWIKVDLLLLLLFLAVLLILGDQLFLHRPGDLFVVRELHVEAGAPLGHGGEVAVVVEHLGHRHRGLDDLRAVDRVH